MAAAIWLFLVMVNSILLDDVLLRKVDLSLSSFIKCRCLLAKYSSSFLPLEFVLKLCHVFERELLSAGIKILQTVTNRIRSTILVKLVLFDLLHQNISWLYRI